MKTDRIEQALRVWELCCMSTKISIKRINMLQSGSANEIFTGPAKHSDSFRKDMLSGKPFDPKKYIERDIKAEGMGVFSYLPASIHEWATASRRIYELDEDTQQLILGTDVSQLSWKDIVFPFNAFGIALARPIQEPGGQFFDFLLVHRGYMHPIGRDGICTWTISKEFERPLGVTMEQARRAYEDMVVHGKMRKGQEISDFLTSKTAMDKTAFGAKLNCLIADSTFFDRPLKDTFSYIRENEGKVAPDNPFPLHGLPLSGMNIEVERLVAGLCVYLDINRIQSSGKKAQSDWKPLDPPTIDTTSISKEALVCTVQNVYDISDLERELLNIPDPIERDRRCKELGAHYREGYARRRPGFGQDPAAPQCVHVRHCIVGLRRLAPGALPRGTEKVL